MKYHKLFFFLMTCLSISYSQAQSYIFFARSKSLGWKFFNIKGEVVIDKILEDTHQFSEDGFAAVTVAKGRYVIINRRGEKIKTETSMEIIRLKDIMGRAPKGYSDGLIIANDHVKYGCLDTLGKVKFPFKYSDIVPFHDGHAMARIKKDFFILDTAGNETRVNDRAIVDIERFQESLAPYKSINGKMGFINIHGEIVIPAQFDRVGFFSKGLAWARNDADLVGYIDTEGKWVIQPHFSTVKNFDIESGMAACKTGYFENGVTTSKWAYINTTGKIIPLEVSDAGRDFSEGLLVNKKDGRYGFINNEGDWVIQPQFEDVKDFNYGLAWANKEGLWGIINKQGNWVLTPRFIAVKNIVKFK